MKINALLDYLCIEFHTAVSRFSPEEKPLGTHTSRFEFDGLSLIDKEFVTTFLSSSSVEMPAIVCINGGLFYSVFTGREESYILGPVGFREPVSVIKQYTSLKKGGRPGDTVAFSDFDRYIRAVAMFQNVINDTQLTGTEIREANTHDISDDEVKRKFSEEYFEKLENAEHHNPYDQEMREFSSIEKGDLELFEKSISEDYSGKLGVLADNPMRSLKNICIVVITLASRAAIRGGVDPEISYSLSDSYMRKIERLNSRSSLADLIRNAERHYIRLVQECQKIRKNPSGHSHVKVTQSKQYISRHLHERLTLEDIAEEVGINPSYLSELFVRCENMSLSEYVIHQKIQLSRSLLTYTDTPLIEIAAFLGFSSQSHFGNHFKRICGITPGKYRQKQAVTDGQINSLD
ncbi:MAG: AraC family transcriptional regulator [Spirochaetales bacterium]|nr:AraC family transcriptional regulator [Spirochaetales bacterium]